MNGGRKQKRDEAEEKREEAEEKVNEGSKAEVKRKERKKQPKVKRR